MRDGSYMLLSLSTRVSDHHIPINMHSYAVGCLIPSLSCAAAVPNGTWTFGIIGFTGSCL